jgi:two-component system chemotaxis response regulator CheY
MKDVHALVVDDTPEVRKLIRMILWGMGIKEVEEASNGSEALSAFDKRHSGKKESTKFDIVVCDIHMPLMDGISLLQEIRKREGGRDLPVIIISGDSTANKIAEAVRFGADDFIIKPYTVKTVEQKVRRVLESRKT